MSMPLLGAGPGAGAPSSGGAESAAFLARTSGLDSTHRNAYIALIDGLVADGVWSHLDVLHIYATDTTSNALLNLVSSSFSGVANGSPTFTADRGYTGSTGSTVYIDTQFNPTTASSPKYVLNDAHLSVWDLATATTFDSAIGHANAGDTSSALIIPKATDNKMYIRLNQAGLAGESFANGSSADGHYTASRSSSNHADAYRNASSLFVNGNGTNALINKNIYTLGYNGASAPVGSICQLAMASIGSFLSSTDVTNFYNRLRTFMTVVGVP